jgi:SAM-dependent methyltransferase
MHKALLPHFRRRLKRLAEMVGRPGRLLDFGCADGCFLELARAAGWDIAGVEIAAQMADAAARRLGLPIAADLRDVPEGQFDAVTLWEVVEHLARPVSALHLLRQRLHPGGVLALSTPNVDHTRVLREPTGWHGFRPPSHVVLFGASAIVEALGRAGFERIEVRRVAPLPPLPDWLEHATARLRHGLSTGEAHPWPAALILWRAVRMAAWGWYRLNHGDGDIFATLEVTAWRPR